MVERVDAKLKASTSVRYPDLLAGVGPAASDGKRLALSAISVCDARGLVTPFHSCHLVTGLVKFDVSAARPPYAHQAITQGSSRDVPASRIGATCCWRSEKSFTICGHTPRPQKSILGRQVSKDPDLFEFPGTREPMLERDRETALAKPAQEDAG